MSKAGMLKKLYIKEMRCLAADIWITLGIILLLSMFVFMRSSLHALGYLVFPLMLMTGLAGLVPVISSFRILSGEWNSNTIYLTLSLPVKGEVILGSKLLALLTQYVIGTLAVGISGILLGLYMIPDFLEILKLNYNSIPWGFYISLYLLGLAFFGYVIGLSFFSQVLGHLFNRFKNLATALIFLASWWLFKKVGFFIARAFSVEKIFLLPPDNIWPNLFSWSFAIILLEALIIFGAAVVVYNRKIEL